MDFSNLLVRLASGSMTTEDYYCLSNRRISILDRAELDQFTDAIYILPTNDDVNAKNEECLRKLNKLVLNIMAHDSPTYIGNIDEKTGLLSDLNIAIGCKIMLTNNTWVEVGLANGSLGTVGVIIFDEDVKPPNPPRYILIQFDNYNGPCVNGNLFPISAINRNCEINGRMVTRKQFPLKVAYAITIHKAQGLTLRKAKIDIGLKEFASGLSYVVLSRVRKLQDLILLIYYDKKRFDVIANSITTQLKLKFLQLLRSKI